MTAYNDIFKKVNRIKDLEVELKDEIWNLAEPLQKWLEEHPEYLHAVEWDIFHVDDDALELVSARKEPGNFHARWDTIPSKLYHIGIPAMRVHKWEVEFFGNGYVYIKIRYEDLELSEWDISNLAAYISQFVDKM